MDASTDRSLLPAGAAALRRLRAAALLVALVAGCAEDGPRLDPLATDAVILAFGDSLTRGTGAASGDSYPATLARLSGRTVLNAGVPGELSAAGAARIMRVLEQTRPALVILCHGGNDMLRKRDLTAARRNLEAMIRAARASGAQVLLLGVPTPGLWLETADFYHEAARTTHTPLDSEALPDVLGQHALKADPIHPNAAGYARLAHRVHDRLIALGAL